MNLNAFSPSKSLYETRLFQSLAEDGDKQFVSSSTISSLTSSGSNYFAEGAPKESAIERARRFLADTTSLPSLVRIEATGHLLCAVTNQHEKTLAELCKFHSANMKITEKDKNLVYTLKALEEATEDVDTQLNIPVRPRFLPSDSTHSRDTQWRDHVKLLEQQIFDSHVILKNVVFAVDFAIKKHSESDNKELETEGPAGSGEQKPPKRRLP